MIRDQAAKAKMEFEGASMKNTLVLPSGSESRCAFLLQLDAPGSPFRKARKAKDYILDAIRDRITEKKREFEQGSVKKDTLLSFFASAKVEEGEPLNEYELSVSFPPDWAPFTDMVFAFMYHHHNQGCQRMILQRSERRQEGHPICRLRIRQG